MRIQLEQIDLAKPWPKLCLRDGFGAMNVFVRIGAAPVGEVMVRPIRKRTVSHRRLRRRIARKLSYEILRVLVRFGVRAGPTALASKEFAGAGARLAGNYWHRAREYVHDHVLDPNGLPAPFGSWVNQERAVNDSNAAPAVTVVVCTRDRAAQLEGCIKSLQGLAYPRFDILICDNSENPMPTRDLCHQMGVEYVREPVAGLSRARNAALRVARTRWVAFTDDDCRPEKNWLSELVARLADSKCACVCGLVRPAQLENSAEIAFEIYGGLGRGCQARVFDWGWLNTSWTKPPQTWRIGAGANMLMDRDLVLKLGGYDVEMGPGGVGGCGEDTLVFYQILNSGWTIHYAPAAIVDHFHRSSDAALRKHIRSYAVGHAAYHWHLIWRYRDPRSAFQLAWHLPRWFVRNWRRGIRGRTRYPHSLVIEEIKGTLAGPVQYSLAKLGRWTSAWLRHGRKAEVPQLPRIAVPDEVERQEVQSYEPIAHQKRMRVA